MAGLALAAVIVPMVAVAQEKAEIPAPTSTQPLDLATAQRIALSENPSLDAAMDRVRQARARVDQARSAYWPRLDADGSGARVWYGEAPTQIPGVTAADEGDIYTAGLSATWTLFDGFQRKFNTLAAQYGEESTRTSRLDTARLLLSSVADAYHNAQLARENIAIAQANEKFNRRQAEDARARRRVGTGSLSDVLNFEVGINAARADVIRARESWETALYGLAALMGDPGGRLPRGMALAPLPPETGSMLTIPEPAEAIDYALSHRPDIRAGELRLKIAEAEIGQARAGYFPRINLSASYEGERVDDLGFEADDFDASVGLRLSCNLFQGGYTKSRVREARDGAVEARNLLTDTRNTAVSEVRTALAALSSAKAQLALQQTNAELVRRNRDLVEKEYAAGQTSLVRLNEAQRDLIQAQGRRALARVSLRQARQRLKAATGEIVEPFDLERL